MEEIARWLWAYIPVACSCNPLSVPSRQAEALVARYAWENPGSEVAVWYQQASAEDRAAFRDYWYALCCALRG